MKLLPEYSQNIVVAVLTSGRTQWYVSEKEEWFLNTISFAKAFGMEASKEEQEIVKALEAANHKPFLTQVADYEVELSELKEWISMSEPESETWKDALPCLIVDMDKKEVKNCFPEASGQFQDFLPSGWSGNYTPEFEEIETRIPEGERFWRS